MQIACPNCQQKLDLPDEDLGKRVKCPTCTEVFRSSAPGNVIDVAPPVSGTDEQPMSVIDVAPPVSGAEITEKPKAQTPPRSSRPMQEEDRTPPVRKPTGAGVSGVLIALLVAGGGLVALLLCAGGVGVGWFLSVDRRDVAVAEAKAIPRDAKRANARPVDPEGAKPVEVKEVPEKPAPKLAEKPAVPEKAVDKPAPKMPEKPPVGPPLGPGPEPELSEIKRVPLHATNDLVYDPTRGLIYASVGNPVIEGNTIVAIHPVKGERVWSIEVGNYPGRMALSSNAAVLWVGLTSKGALQRIDLERGQAGPLLPLGNGPFGELFVEEMVVAPNTTDTIVVSLGCPRVIPRHQGVAVFDNGVCRPNKTRTHTGSNRITLADDTTLFGYNSESTEFGLRRLRLENNGIREVENQKKLIDGPGLAIAYANGRVYSSGGHIVDPGRGVLIGKLPLPPQLDKPFELRSKFDRVRGPFALDPAKKRAFFLLGKQIHAFDTDSLTRAGMLQVSREDAPRSPLFNEEDATRLILLGSSGFAFQTREEVVILPRQLLP